MKHIRRTVAICLAVAFCIAAALGAGVILSVKNVNIIYNDHSGAFDDAYAETAVNLSQLKGGSILYVDEEDVLSRISDTSRLRLDCFEKIYPCSLDIVIAERAETFYSYDGAAYSVYDEEGEFMYRSSNIVNPDSGYAPVLAETPDVSPNVMIDGDLTDEERAFVADASEAFGSEFDSLRRLVGSVELQHGKEYDNLVFYIRTGLCVEITDCAQDTHLKIRSAYARFCSLSDSEKTCGRIRSYNLSDGNGDVRSVYIPPTSLV